MNREIKFRAWDGVDWMSKPFDLFDIMNEYIEFSSNSILMQYTGLKDKNGKEIYEGDIMNHPEFASEKGKKASLIVNFKDGSYRLNSWDCVRVDFSLGEVIGNIHENPELLK